MKQYTSEQCKNGGRARAATAKRHPAYGIFLPDVMLYDDILFPDCYQHGKAGGRTRVIKALRDERGRFTKGE